MGKKARDRRAVAREISRLKRHFEFDYLSPHLQAVAVLFRRVAKELCRTLPAGLALVGALQSLVQAKDFAIRAAVDAGAER